MVPYKNSDTQFMAERAATALSVLGILIIAIRPGA
jgi:hypothetical protein